MACTCSPRSLVTAFAGGALSVIVFHQSAVAALYGLSVMPPGFEPWSMSPIPPLGIPVVLSKAFWGGLWAILLWQFLHQATGIAYWVSWAVLGAMALPLVAIFVVPPLKGAPIPDIGERLPLYALINALWGLGTALIMRLLRAADNGAGSGVRRGMN